LESATTVRHPFVYFASLLKALKHAMEKKLLSTSCGTSNDVRMMESSTIINESFPCLSNANISSSDNGSLSGALHPNDSNDNKDHVKIRSPILLGDRPW